MAQDLREDELLTFLGGGGGGGGGGRRSAVSGGPFSLALDAGQLAMLGLPGGLDPVGVVDELDAEMWNGVVVLTAEAMEGMGMKVKSTECPICEQAKSWGLGAICPSCQLRLPVNAEQTYLPGSPVKNPPEAHDWPEACDGGDAWVEVVDGVAIPRCFPRLFEACAMGQEVWGLGGSWTLDGLGRLGSQWSVAQQQAMRNAVAQAWAEYWPHVAPTLGGLQFVQALCAHEGGYGLGWKDGVSPVSGCPWNMVGSWNMGAVQCCKADGCNCPPGSGLYTDSHPTAAGQQKYDVCFVRYASASDGVKGILKTLNHMPKVLAVMQGGNLDDIALAMRQSHYYEGFSTDPMVAAKQYASALNKQAAAIATALGEPQAARERGFSGGDGTSEVTTWTWMEWIAAGIAAGAVGWFTKGWWLPWILL